MCKLGSNIYLNWDHYQLTRNFELSIKLFKVVPLVTCMLIQNEKVSAIVECCYNEAQVELANDLKSIKLPL